MTKFDARTIAGHNGALSSWILSAQQASLSHDQRIDSLILDSLTRGVPDLPVGEAITRAEVTLTIDGAATLEIDLHDPEWLVQRSGFLDPDENGRLNTSAVAIDGLWFRMAADRRQDPDTQTLVFEAEAKTLLDRYSSHVHVSRSKLTRAEFIGALLFQVSDRPLVYVSPQEHQRQLVKHPDLPNATPRDTGFDAGTRFKIKSAAADASQMRNVATVMTVCDQYGVTDRVRLAALVAGIGESEFRAVSNRAGSGYAGVFQADPDNIPAKDTEQQARYFLKGGKGFQAGGAIAYAAAHPTASAGEIAYKVEGSRSNFASDSAAEAFYQANHGEAQTIAGLWNSGQGGKSSTVLSYKAYEFTRGLPGQTETSWQAAVRLADQVNWRFFAIGSVVSFVSDDFLLSKPAGLVLDPLENGAWDVPTGLLSMPEYDQDRGKFASQVTLRAVANAWGVLPGEVVVLRNMGSISGRWITETFTFDLLDATQAAVTLIRPIPPLHEPAPDVITADVVGSDDLSSGAQRTLAWARSKLGHYREEFGRNTGRELDVLEAKFNLRGEPWCAMFATTALVVGGVSRDCRTPRVKDINTWAAGGSHGFQKGFRATPQPGDLITFGDDHVGIVEKVNGEQVTTIEGNTSAGTVQRVSRTRNSGRYARPDYPA